jgi:hypothetical protein
MHGPRTGRNSNKLTSSRRVLVAAAVLIGIIALPSPAAADVGMPMIVLVWPGAWVLFLPVVALESVVANRLLKLSAGRALRVSFVANLVSTLAGIPVTWLLLLMLQWLIIGVAVNVLPETPSTRVQALLRHVDARRCGDVAVRAVLLRIGMDRATHGPSHPRPDVRDGSRILELAGQPVELRWPDGRSRDSVGGQSRMVVRPDGGSPFVLVNGNSGTPLGPHFCCDALEPFKPVRTVIDYSTVVRIRFCLLTT